MNYSMNFLLLTRNNLSRVKIRVAWAGNKLDYYPGLGCRSDQWEKNKDQGGKLINGMVTPSGMTSKEFNTELSRYRTIINNIMKSFEDRGKIPDIPTLQKALKERLKSSKSWEAEENFFVCFDHYIEHQSINKNISDGRIKHIKTTLKKIELFDPNVSFSKIDHEWLDNFNSFLLKKYEHNGIKGVSQNTATCDLKKLKAFCNFALVKDWLKKSPFLGFNMPQEIYGEPVYITTKERDKLFNADIETPHLAKTRDMFVLQCYLGCRYNDLVQLRHDNIINGRVEYIASKTKDKENRVAKVPLAPKALEIIKRYNIPTGDLVGYCSNQKYNEHIKEVFKLVGITRIVTIRDPKTRTAKRVPICDIVSSHMARRAFIGNLYSKVKDSVIASMSGHTKNSKAFSRYYTITLDDQKNAIEHLD